MKIKMVKFYNIPIHSHTDYRQVSWEEGQRVGKLDSKGNLCISFRDWGISDVFFLDDVRDRPLDAVKINTTIFNILNIFEGKDEDYKHFTSVDASRRVQMSSYYKTYVRYKFMYLILDIKNERVFCFREMEHNIKIAKELINFYNENFTTGLLTKGAR